MQNVRLAGIVWVAAARGDFILRKEMAPGVWLVPLDRVGCPVNYIQPDSAESGFCGDFTWGKGDRKARTQPCRRDRPAYSAANCANASFKAGGNCRIIFPFSRSTATNVTRAVTNKSEVSTA